jgi:YD repeat-containing protein
LISTTLPDGSVQTQRYDADNHQTSTIDANGNRINLVYDARGRLIRRIEQRPNQPELVTTFEYDAANQQTAIVDANNHRTEYRYNDLGQRITVIDAPSTPISSTTRTEYDLVGNVTKEIDGLGNQTQTVYDHRDRVIRVISPSDPSTPTGTTITRYDGAGNIIELTDPVGNKTTYTYDPRNRLKTDTNQLNLTRTYVYDAASNRTQVTDRNGIIRTFTYDNLNRQTAENWLNNTGGAIRTTSFVYDAADQLVRVSDPDSSYDFSYDLLGRRVGVDNIGTPGVPRVVLGYSYDLQGNVIGVSDRINGTARGVTNYTYDPLNRLTQITQSGTGVATKRVNFDHDNLGQYKTINRYSDLAGTQLVVGTNYTYDGKNRLDVLSHNRGGGALALYDFDYDNADRITRINSLVDGVTNYTYDNQNQLRVADHNIAANPDESYTYDANGNRISKTGSRGNRSYTTPANSDNRLQSDGVFNYLYDNEGNLVRKTEIATGKVTEYTWDYVNRLVEVIERNSQGGAAVRNVGFSYDAMGRRISKSVDNNPADTIEGAVSYFVYDREHVILDFVDSDGRSGVNVPVQSRRYLFGNNTDQILSQEDGAGANVN